MTVAGEPALTIKHRGAGLASCVLDGGTEKGEIPFSPHPLTSSNPLPSLADKKAGPKIIKVAELAI